MNAYSIHVLFTNDMFILGTIYICIPYIHGSYQLDIQYVDPQKSPPLKTWRPYDSVCRSVGRAWRWFHPYCVPTASSRPRYAGSLGGKSVFFLLAAENRYRFLLLLMVQKSCDHQLRLVVYPIIYRVFTSKVVQDFSHQQYFYLRHCFSLWRGGELFCFVCCFCLQL